MDLGRVYECWQLLPDRNTGCSDLIWLSDAYDYVTGVVSFIAIFTFIGMIYWDLYKRYRSAPLDESTPKLSSASEPNSSPQTRSVPHRESTPFGPSAIKTGDVGGIVEYWNPELQNLRKLAVSKSSAAVSDDYGQTWTMVRDDRPRVKSTESGWASR